MNLRFDPLCYINEVTDSAYESLDEVPRQDLVTLMAIGVLAIVKLDYAPSTEGDLALLAERYDWLTLVEDDGGVVQREGS